MELDPIFYEIHQDLPRQGVGRDIYTRQAFQMLPKVHEPRILDIGCGPGAQTVELAKLSHGQVIGLDNHEPYLEQLRNNAKEANVADHIEVVNGSMFELNYPEQSFDLLWAEGSIFIIGFEQGLKQWRSLIKPNGLMAISELVWLQPDPPKEVSKWLENAYPDIRTVPKNVEIIETNGYKLLGQFTMPKDAWWAEYYTPLEDRVQMLRKKYADNVKALAFLDAEDEEMNMHRNHSEWYGYVFFVMQRKD